MAIVQCRNPKCGADSIEVLTAKHDHSGRKLGNPSILGIAITTVLLFCLMGVIVTFISAVLQSTQGKPIDNHIALALVALWIGSVIWWLRARLRARRQFAEAPWTYAYNCLQCGQKWSRREGGTQPGAERGPIDQAARRLEAAERRRWRDAAAWGDYYPREGDR
jgi:hypothetical protein